MFPPLNPDHESIHLPETMLKTLNIAGTVGRAGGDIAGADMIYNYEQVLRQVTYTNMKPAYYLNRQFKILCSELNERFVSNEYVQTVSGFAPPWDRPNSNRLMGPPIFYALLLITYTFSRYMLKRIFFLNIYSFKIMCPPTLKLFIFCLFWTENQ